MKSNAPTPSNCLVLNLQYLNTDQAAQLIKMFDSPESYAENFSTLKAIARGLYKIIENESPEPKSQIGRMFGTVNNLQGILLLDDAQEVDRVLRGSGLMPNPWHGFAVPQHIDVDSIHNEKGVRQC